MSLKPRVLVLGATGLFGELLARRIAADNTFALIAAGRGSTTLAALQEQVKCDIAIVDRDDANAIDSTLALHKPFAVVDCAGPFQHYGADPYRFARQVIKAGSHYIDIADASAFVVAIGELDELAKQYSVTAISGASSTPAISAAVADTLTEGMARVVSIETAIIPGNRARRTFSVMKAILSQIGKPFEITRHGEAETVYGWGETQTVNLKLPDTKPVTNRLASLVQTPDIEIFPQRYQAETVTLRAGLEVKAFHRFLQCSAALVRWKILPSLAPATSFMRWIASGFEWMGSDMGGMQVKVTGRKTNGNYVQRIWDLVADDGRGPEIPTLPVSVVLDKLNQGLLNPGASASPGEITLGELASRFDAIDAKTVVYENQIQPVFKTILGDDFDALPPAVQALHNTIGQTTYTGVAQSGGPTGLTGRLAAWLIRFPSAGVDVPIKVTITADACGETWQRDFNGVTFKSRLSAGSDGFARESFGFMSARLGLKLNEGRLHFPVLDAKLFGVVPVPRFLLPVSVAHETIDEQGRFVFDVLLKTPFGSRIAHYQGWLVCQE